MVLTEAPAPVETTSQPPPLYIIRNYTPTDAPFVSQAWIDAFRCSSNRMKRIEPTVFNRFCHKMVRRILQRAEVRIASPPNDGITIYGFAVLEPKASPLFLHMVFVRKVWRKLGIGKALLKGINLGEGADWKWTTVTGDVDAWLRNKYDMDNRHQPFWMDDYGNKTATAGTT